MFSYKYVRLFCLFFEEALSFVTNEKLPFDNCAVSYTIWMNKIVLISPIIIFPHTFGNYSVLTFFKLVAIAIAIVIIDDFFDLFILKK